MKASGRIYFVGVHEIDWIEAMGHYLTLHTGSGTHLVRDTIANLTGRLDADRFVRIERGAIVNVDRIEELRPAFHGDLEVVLKSGARLRVSRSYAVRLREWVDKGRV
jgi:two-component system LytT family response regulator